MDLIPNQEEWIEVLKYRDGELRWCFHNDMSDEVDKASMGQRLRLPNRKAHLQANFETQQNGTSGVIPTHLNTVRISMLCFIPVVEKACGGSRTVM